MGGGHGRPELFTGLHGRLAATAGLRGSHAAGYTLITWDNAQDTVAKQAGVTIKDSAFALGVGGRGMGT